MVFIDVIIESPSAIQNGATSFEFSLHHGMPVGGIIVIAILDGGVGAVAKVYHRIAYVHFVGIAELGRILRLDSLAAVTHQPSDRISLYGGVRTAVIVSHVVPVQCNTRQFFHNY